MKLQCGNQAVFELRKQIDMRDAADIYSSLRVEGKPAFLFESRSVNPLYGRMSLIGINPTLEIVARGELVTIQILRPRGEAFFVDFLESGIADEVDEIVERTKEKVVLRIKKDNSFLPEEQRTRRKNTVSILHRFLKFFRCETESLLGVYGAFSYDFARLFEELPSVHPERANVPEYHFFLFDTFVRIDLIKDTAEIICYRSSDLEVEKAVLDCSLRAKDEALVCPYFSVGEIECDTGKHEYEELVRAAKQLAKQGDTFEVVFSRCFTGNFFGDPFAVYRIYREKNPAPYLFFFDFGDDQLVGASPEMMVRVEHGKAHLRPISGTRPRGADPISDHEHMLELLKCEKERAELDMLIDLGRNDLKRVCAPGIDITAYRVVERYSRVMHTIAHLTGNLRPECTALDALIACQSAGTLTGAPKVQAMIEIEKHEKARRGYYGGSVGYLTFAGDMDTGIIIRTAHIHNGRFEFRVGATLLYDSDPHDEYLETENKAQALLEILNGN